MVRFSLEKPGTPVRDIKGYGDLVKYGDEDTWLSAYSLCCGLPDDEEVIETIGDCIHYGTVTRYMVSCEFRDKVYNLASAIGIECRAFLRLEDESGNGFANLTACTPDNFMWTVPDFESVKKLILSREVKKSVQKFEYAEHLRRMDEAYPLIRDIIVRDGCRGCSPWARCNMGYGMCSRCLLASMHVSDLHPLVRDACVHRLVEEGIVNPGWGDNMPGKRPVYVDKYA